MKRMNRLVDAKNIWMVPMVVAVGLVFWLASSVNATDDVKTSVMNPPRVIEFDVNGANPYQIANPDEVVEFSLEVEVTDADGDETIVQYTVDVDEDSNDTINQSFVWLPGEVLPGITLGKGDHLLTFTATDDAGLTAVYDRRVRLYENGSDLQDLPPVVNVHAPSPAEVFASWPVLFSGEAIPDFDSTIVRYTWVLGNGSTRTGAEVQYTYSAAGIYEVYLQVEDDDGFVTNSDVMTVTVTQTDEPSPTLTLTPTPGPSPTPKAADTDLIIGKPTLITAPPIVNGMPLTFTVEITNTGTADVTNLFFVDLFFDVPEDQIEPSGISIEYSSGYRVVNDLTAGASRTITVTSSFGFSNGANPHTVHAMVDSVLQISETNEENNLGGILFVESVPNTATATLTATMSPSQTPTHTATPTATPTHTATPTASHTPAPSVTPTPEAVNVDYAIYLPFVGLGLD